MNAPLTASMQDALAKVHELHRYEAGFAGANYTTRFMRYVADPESAYFRDSDAVYAETFLLQIFTALNDAPLNRNSVGGMPPTNAIGGFPAQMFMFIQQDIPKVADVIFPADFAAHVKEAYADMRHMFEPVQRRAG